MEEELHTDAVGLDHHPERKWQSRAQHTLRGDESEIMKSLDHDDITKMAFLIYDLLPLEIKEKVVDFVDGRSEALELHSLLQDIPDSNILEELLFLTKNYYLLPNLNTCKHKAEVKFSSSGIVSKLRRILFDVCEELSDKELEILKNLMDVEHLKNTPCAESFFLHLQMEGKLPDKMYDSLVAALKQMHRDDLVFKVSEVSTLLNCYKITSRIPRGLAVIVNLENFKESQSSSRQDSERLEDRTGSSVDKDKLVLLWRKFGLKPVILENLTADSMMEQLRGIAKCDHSKYDIFICCILSHGAKGGVYGVDGQFVKTSVIREIFSNAGAPLLVAKPKLFFIQACQGKEINQGAPVSNPKITDSDNLKTDGAGEAPPNFADMLLVTSTVARFASIRCPNLGGWFISALVEEMENYWEQEDISQVLTRVNRAVAGKTGMPASSSYQWRQMPEFINTLRFQLKLSKVM